MLPLSEIETFYPDPLHRFPRFMLREYLQHKILEIVFDSQYATDLCFLGGTCLRIVHHNRRFSEDLDFDNLSMKEAHFGDLGDYIQQQLEREGYQVELKTVMKGAWHCHIKFPGLLYEEGLTGHRKEKILIRLDTEPQHFNYEPGRFILNRFEVFTTILTTPLSLLMAQKFYAAVNRQRPQGRDLYDLVFLMAKGITPNYHYLEATLSVSTPASLQEAVLKKCEEMDMEAMAKDVEPFLFDPSELKKVTNFPTVLRQYDL